LHGDLIPLALRATFPEKNFGIMIASYHPDTATAKENQEKNN
jgi:hypothetical protein